MADSDKLEQEIEEIADICSFYETINNDTLQGVRLIIASAFYPFYQTEDILTPEGDAEVDAFYDKYIYLVENGTYRDFFLPSTEEQEKFGTSGFSDALKLAALAYKAEPNSDESRRLLHGAACRLASGFGYFEGWHKSAAYKGANAAKAAHREHHALRDHIVQYYLENKDKYQSKDAAAEDIAKKIVPLGFRAVRRHLNNL